MNTSLREDAWGGAAFETVDAARAEASRLLLSAYISALNAIQSGAEQASTFKLRTSFLSWGIRAEYHAKYMRMHSAALNYDQLNVLATWLTATSCYFPPRKRIAEIYATKAARGVLLNDKALPHERALIFASAAYAKVQYLRFKTDAQEIEAFIGEALALEDAVCCEADWLQALRQWVRVLKTIGMIKREQGFSVGAREYWFMALELAEGEALTRSQAEHIKQLLAGLN